MTYNIYVDESIHYNDKFIVTAIVGTPVSLEKEIEESLIIAGLKPKVDEYKSSGKKINNLSDQKLRDDLNNILISKNCRIGLIICNISERDFIAEHVLRLISEMALHEKFGKDFIVINFDDGLLTKKAKELATLLPLPKISIDIESDSRKVLGLQLADMVAHMVATIIRCDIGSLKKATPAGSNMGYASETMIELEFELWAKLRYSLASSEPTDYLENNELNYSTCFDSFGLFISDFCEKHIREAAYSRFNSVYLGCIH